MSAIQAGGDTVRIGIDVGGTKIAGVLLAEAADGDARPKLLAERSIPARPGAEQLVDDVVSVVGRLTKDAPAAAGIATIGIGTPGMVDAATGAVENIANLDIVRVELGGEVARRTGVPTRVENDVNAAALGAAAMLPPTDGAGDKGTVVFLNLGTGLAAGVIRGGELDLGYSNNVAKSSMSRSNRTAGPAPADSAAASKLRPAAARRRACGRRTTRRCRRSSPRPAIQPRRTTRRPPKHSIPSSARSPTPSTSRPRPSTRAASLSAAAWRKPAARCSTASRPSCVGAKRQAASSLRCVCPTACP
ncbi:Sugar kinase, ROK family [Bifidobacterium breve S27]|nr:Sugar kinase, ROK family [Bifidobacterium breve S27]